MKPQAIVHGFFHAFLLTLVASWTTIIWYLIASRFGSLAAGALSVLVGVGLVGWLAATRVPAPRLPRLGVRAFPARFVPALVLLIPTIVVALEMQALLRIVWGAPPGRGFHKWSPGMIDTGSAWGILFSVLAFVVVFPCVVELFFRGLVHEGMVARFGRLRGTAAVALLYTIFVISLTQPKEFFTHGIVRWAVLILSALVWGLVLGVVRTVTGSVLASIALHGCANLVWLIFVALGDRMPVSAVSAPGAHVPLAILVPGVLSVAVGLTLLLRARPAQGEA